MSSLFELPYSFSLNQKSSYFPSLHSTMLILSVSHFSLFSWNGCPSCFSLLQFTLFFFLPANAHRILFQIVFHVGLPSRTSLPRAFRKSAYNWYPSIGGPLLTLFTPITLKFTFFFFLPPNAHHILLPNSFPRRNYPPVLCCVECFAKMYFDILIVETPSHRQPCRFSLPSVKLMN